MKGPMMGAKTNQMNPTIDEAGEKGKCLEPMRCMVSSTTHMHASVIKVMGKIGNQDVSFLIDSGSTHCFTSLKFLKTLNVELGNKSEDWSNLLMENYTILKGI